MSILAVGTVAFDSVETPFGKAERILGGSATYLSLAAKYFCPGVAIVGIVGNDFGDDQMAYFRERSIDLSGLEVDEDGKSFFWSGRYSYDLNDRDTLRTDLNVLKDFEPKVPNQFRDAPIICLGNLDPEVQHSVLDQCYGGYVVCDTMNYWIEKTPESLMRLLRRVDCLIINDSEARQLADTPSLIKAGSVIRRMGPSILVIKKGEHGALLFADGTVFAVPAYPLEDIVDPTGAGDTFMGGFAGYLASESEITIDAVKRAMVYGSAMASFVVEAFGPERILNLTPSDIENRIDGFRRLSAIPDFVTFVQG